MPRRVMKNKPTKASAIPKNVTSGAPASAARAAPRGSARTPTPTIVLIVIADACNTVTWR